MAAEWKGSGATLTSSLFGSRTPSSLHMYSGRMRARRVEGRLATVSKVRAASLWACFTAARLGRSQESVGDSLAACGPALPLSTASDEGSRSTASESADRETHWRQSRSMQS